MNLAARIDTPRAVRFDPEARTYEAYSLAGRTERKGPLQAATLEQAQAEATERWSWDRGDRIGIRETGREDAPTWPFAKQPFDRLHIFAVQRSAPLRWELDRHGRSRPLYRYSLKLLCAVDLAVVA